MVCTTSIFSSILFMGISLAAGLISSYAAYLLTKNIIAPAPSLAASQVYAPEIFIALEKSAEHLKIAKNKAPEEINSQVDSIMNELNAMKETMSHPEDYTVSSGEYKIIERMFSYLQIISACLMAFAHGANDVANAIGPLTAAVSALNTQSMNFSPEIPLWALALGGFGIVIGLATWGWRVIETIGKKLTELTPTRGFAAEFSAALTILVASRLGMPISTTHTLVGAVVGVGLARGIEALNLATMRDVILSWLITVPAGAVLTIIVFYVLNQFTG
jgi:phosphate/sulfate permease